MDAKSVGVIVLVVSCFFVVYPRIFHPILMNICGLNPKKAEQSPEQPPFHPGGMQGHPNAGGSRQGMNFPHPGMRAQPHSAPPGGGGGGGGKGGWVTMILPVYSVGIVIYLIYTLSKIWSNKDNRFEAGRAFYGGQQYPSKHAETPHDHGFGGEEESLEGYKSEIKQGQKQLERLLLKANDNTIEREEMVVLRQRLQETEAQLTRIMTAMESMHDSVEEVVSNASEQQENTESNELKKADTRCTDAENYEASHQEDIEDQHEAGDSDDDSVSDRLSNSEDIRPPSSDETDNPASLPDTSDVVEELMPEHKEHQADSSVRRRLHCEESEV